MSHGLTFREDGTVEAAFAERLPWHDLGTRAEQAMTSIEAMRLAYLEWLVHQYPAYMKLNDGTFREVPEFKFNARSDNQFVMGVVKNNYKVVQNIDAFQITDSLIMDGIMKYESAFSLNGGKDVVLLAKLPTVDTVVEGDDSHRYLLMVLNHAGIKCIQWLPTSVRVVCGNTTRLAMGKGKGQIIKIRHTGDMNHKLTDARNTLLEINEAFTTENNKFRVMASRTITPPEFKEYMNFLYPVPSVTDTDFTFRKQQKQRDIRMVIQHNFLEHPNQRLEGIKMSQYAAYNAVTQYEDHRTFRGKDESSKAETRFKTTMLGEANDVKIKARTFWNDKVSSN